MEIDITRLEPEITNIINHHLNGWTWKWDKATRRYGCCHHRQKLITISKTLASMNPWEETKDTVLHEVAHAIVGCRHGHDQTWKNACKMIGARPNQYYDSAKVAQPIPKYYAVCAYCGKVSYSQRMPRTRKYSCGRCSHGRFNPDYILEFKPNPLGGLSNKDYQNTL